MGVEIVIDTREKFSEFFLTEIQKHWPATRVEKLLYGDFRIDQTPNGQSFTIERKTASDFQGSWFSNRLDQQVANLILKCKDMLHHPALIFELDPGKMTKYIDLPKLEEHLETINFMVPVIQTGSMLHTAKKVVDYARRVGRGSIQVLRADPVIQRAETVWQQMLVGIPGISVEKAKAIAKKYPTPINLSDDILLTSPYNKIEHGKKKDWNLTRWFDGIDGIGGKVGGRVEKLFHEGEWE